MVWYGMVWLKNNKKSLGDGWMGSVTRDDTFLGLSRLNSFVGTHGWVKRSRNRKRTRGFLK